MHMSNLLSQLHYSNFHCLFLFQQIELFHLYHLLSQILIMETVRLPVPLVPSYLDRKLSGSVLICATPVIRTANSACHCGSRICNCSNN